MVFKLVFSFGAPENKISWSKDKGQVPLSGEEASSWVCWVSPPPTQRFPLLWSVKRAAVKVNSFSGLRYHMGQGCSHDGLGHWPGRECHLPMDGKGFVVDVSAIVLF